MINKKSQVIIFCTFMLLIIVGAFPYFTGSLFEKKFQINEVPSYWSDAANWINTQQDDYKVLLTPDPYGPVYLWNGSQAHTRSDIAISLIKKPLIVQMPGIGSSDDFVRFIYNQMKSNSTTNLSKILGQMNIGYVLQRNDIDWSYYGSINPKQMKDFLAQQDGIELIGTFGYLDLYRNNFSTPKIYAANELISINKGTEPLSYISTLNWIKNNTMLIDGNANLNLSGDKLKLKMALTNISTASLIITQSGFYDIDILTNLLFVKTPDTLRLSLRNVWIEENNNFFFDLIDLTDSRTILTRNLGNVPFSNQKTYNLSISDPALNGYNLTDSSRFKIQVRNDYALIASSPLFEISSINFQLDDVNHEIYDTNDSVFRLTNIFLSSGDHQILLDPNNSSTFDVFVSPILSSGPLRSINYVATSPALYHVYSNCSSPFFLVFGETYNAGWKLYPGEIDWIGILLNKPYEEDRHIAANYGFTNAWYIDKSSDQVFTIIYYPQLIQGLGYLLTGVFFTMFMAIYIYFFRSRISELIRNTFKRTVNKS